MRVVVEIDEELYIQARKVTQARRIDDVVRYGFEHLIQHDASMRLARLGGSQPNMKDIPRRRSKKSSSQR